MSYGMEVTNSSGRTVFNTDEVYPNFYVPAAVTTVNGYSADPSFTEGSTTEILMGRPKDNNTGTLFLEDDGTSYKFGGSQTYLQTFGAANGVKYFYLKRQDALTPASSGYGIEILKPNGTDLQFSGNINRGFEILLVANVAGGSQYIFTNSDGYDFNDLFIAMTCTKLKYNYSPGGGYVPAFHGVYGMWATFTDTGTDSTCTITVRNGTIVTAAQILENHAFQSNWVLAQYNNQKFFIGRILS